MEALQDIITLATATPNDCPSTLLIYFIPGNPGCVEYYRQFLVNVQKRIPPTARIAIEIHGESHDGFELNPATPPPSVAEDCTRPYSLQQVIEGTKRRLSAKVRDLRSRSENVRVVLVGHSVGAYILLEVISWWQSQRDEQKVYDLKGGVCLFPTIVDIAKSEKGRVFSKAILIPYLPTLAQWLARLLACVPLWLWNWPKTMTPGDKRPEHIAVTQAVICSPQGAEQVVRMAADEMREIKEDKWHPATLWGVLPHEGNKSKTVVQVNDKAPRTKLFFYWGEDDYWVDNDIRDTLIRNRARREGEKRTENWPEMVVDQHTMDHCFSMADDHCAIVSDQVASWIQKLHDQ